eukprot:4898494-Amphidinium_carterae.1
MHHKGSYQKGKGKGSKGKGKGKTPYKGKGPAVNTPVGSSWYPPARSRFFADEWSENNHWESTPWQNAMEDDVWYSPSEWYEWGSEDVYATDAKGKRKGKDKSSGKRKGACH